MKFENALALMHNGVAVRRSSWNDNNFLERDDPRWSVGPEDVFADDWEMIYSQDSFKNDLEELASVLNRMKSANFMPDAFPLFSKEGLRISDGVNEGAVRYYEDKWAPVLKPDWREG